MMLRAAYCRYDLQFKEPAITSRQTMTTKETWLVKVWHEGNQDYSHPTGGRAVPELPWTGRRAVPGPTSDQNIYGIGECAVFRGLSADDTPDYEERLAAACRDISRYETERQSRPARTPSNPTPADGYCNLVPRDLPSSIRFGIETVLDDLRNGGVRRPFPSPWSLGEGAITINGLVWMGSIEQMCQRVEQKIEQGFRCIKFKVGGVNFADELRMIQAVRARFSPSELEIRLDANGAFTAANVDERLAALAPLSIHSIEQPVTGSEGRPRPVLISRQNELLARVCRTSPIPVALDESLIGIDDPADKQTLLEAVRPRYIILKPSLCGGFSGAREWIDIAESLGIGWWVTSALESNIGLNAIAQWVSTLGVTMPQGLGTGALYTNNIPSPLVQTGATLAYEPAATWDIPELPWIEV